MKEFQCFICGKEFDNVDSMSHHQYGVHSTEELKCNQCNKKLLGKKNMAAHMDSHKKIFCPLCEKNIPKNSKNSHKCNIIDRFLCELCTYESPRTLVIWWSF